MFLQWAGQVNIDIDEQIIIGSGSGRAWLADLHPPLPAFLSYNFAKLTGYSTVAFFLVSKVNSLVALWVIYLLNREFLPNRLALLATATYAGGFAFLSMSLSIDNNSILHALWPAVALFAWRGLQNGRWADWAWLGLFMGLALLGKYYSVLLGASVLGAVIWVFVIRNSWQLSQLAFAVLLSLLVFAPHLVVEVQSGFPTVAWAFASAEGTTYAGSDGRASIPTYVLTNLAYNALGLGVVAFIAWRNSWFHRPKGLNAEEKMQLSFLVVIGLLFPLLPVLLSLLVGVSLKPSWGFNALFLTPGLLLWLAYNKDRETFAQLKWWKVSLLMPIYLSLACALIIANGFSDVSRPPAVQEFSSNIDTFWRGHTHQNLELVNAERARDGDDLLQ